MSFVLDSIQLRMSVRTASNWHSFLILGIMTARRKELEDLERPVTRSDCDARERYVERTNELALPIQIEWAAIPQ